MGTQIKKFQIEDDAIDSVKIKDGSLVDQDIAANADIKQSKIENLEEDLATKINLTGDTFTGILTLHADPVNPFHACTKQYLEQLLSNVVVSDPEFVSSIETFGFSGNLTIGPHVIAVGSVAQSSNISVNIALGDTSNFEGANNTTNGTYYIYATGTGFKLSLTAPVFQNGFWVRNTLGWRCISSIQKITSGFIPFIKVGKTVLFKQYQVILGGGSGVVTVNPFGSVATSEALITCNVLASSTTWKTSTSATITLLDPTYLTATDHVTVVGKVANNADRAVAIHDTQAMIAPVGYSGTTPFIKLSLSGKGKIVNQNGYIEHLI